MIRWLPLAIAFTIGCSDPSSGVSTSASGAGAGTGGASPTSTSVGPSGTGAGPSSSGAGGAGGMTPIPPDDWFVSKSGDNSDGKSWATAWNELDRIDWNAVSPGDRIGIEGGTYTTRLVPTKGGTAAAHIVVERSREAGHDGAVVFDFTKTSVPDYWAGYVTIHEPYITIDGHDWNKFDWITDSSCLLIIDDMEDADYVEIANTRLEGHANPDNGGAALCIFSGSVSLDRVWFGTQIGAEDHIKLVTTTQSSLKVENSVFSPWISINGSHSDLIEQCWPGCMAGDLTFKRNLVWDSGPGGGNLVFTLDPHWANVDVSYNVFMDTYEVFQFTSRGGLRISNNVFYNVFSTIGGDDTFEAVNNVFAAPANNSSIVWGSTPKYSLWTPGTYGFFDGGGTNLQADPMFLDPTSILGADGIPFTDDDGFNLKPGSPAIDKGTPTVDLGDIRGRAIGGAPDIGAYESK